MVGVKSITKPGAPTSLLVPSEIESVDIIWIYSGDEFGDAQQVEGFTALVREEDF